MQSDGQKRHGWLLCLDVGFVSKELKKFYLMIKCCMCMLFEEKQFIVPQC
jgi:hypothetical protein